MWLKHLFISLEHLFTHYKSRESVPKRQHDSNEAGYLFEEVNGVLVKATLALFN